MVNTVTIAGLMGVPAALALKTALQASQAAAQVQLANVQKIDPGITSTPATQVTSAALRTVSSPIVSSPFRDPQVFISPPPRQVIPPRPPSATYSTGGDLSPLPVNAPASDTPIDWAGMLDQWSTAMGSLPALSSPGWDDGKYYPPNVVVSPDMIDVESSDIESDFLLWVQAEEQLADTLYNPSSDDLDTRPKGIKRFAKAKLYIDAPPIE